MIKYLSRIEKKENIEYSSFDKFIFILYSAYFILVPFYFWRSGIPQLSDLVLLFVMLIIMIKNKFKIIINKDTESFLLVGSIFILHVIFVNLIWTLILNSSINMIITSFYYIYNFFVCYLITYLYLEYKQKILELTYRAVVLSVIAQGFIFFINGAFTGGRMTGGFNNPNQLGYYSLMTASIIIFISSKISIRHDVFIVAIIITFLLVIASLSTTSTVSYIILILCFLLSKSENRKFKVRVRITILLMILSVIIVYKTTNIIHQSNMLRGIQVRISVIENKVDGISERGYYRIMDYPQYWILGSGEGEYMRRFGSRIEFHSTLGNIQVSYGIIGSLLFLCFIFKALKNNGYNHWYILVSIMIYGLTHNGIRSSLLWILLALIASS